MPIIKSAIKKQRVDKKKTARNSGFEKAFKTAIKGYKRDIGAKKKVSLSAVYKAIDKAVSKKIIPKNKAARLKSAFSKAVKKGGAKK